MRANPTINWRHIVYQSVKATGFDEIDFSNKVTDKLQEAGKSDAKVALGLAVEVDEQVEEQDETKKSFWSFAIE